MKQAGLPGLVEVLHEEGLDGVRYVLWDAMGWHRDYSPAAWRNRATEEQKRRGWEMAVPVASLVLVGISVFGLGLLATVALVRRR